MNIDTITRKAPYRPKEREKVSIETFLEKYRKGAPGLKYEYNQGIIEQTETMKSKEQYIFHNIFSVFKTTEAFKQEANLVQELEVWTSDNQWRKPDIAFITLPQIRAAANGFEPVPEFMIEVISKNDKINEVKNKVKEYFEAGVKVLWHIFPNLEQVEVYRVFRKSETFVGDEICSADPVIKAFGMSVNDILKK
ncbi:MAG: Uma2 family endonuclease [Bacteroidota bacterium]